MNLEIGVIVLILLWLYILIDRETHRRIDLDRDIKAILEEMKENLERREGDG